MGKPNFLRACSCVEGGGTAKWVLVGVGVVLELCWSFVGVLLECCWSFVVVVVVVVVVVAVVVF